MPDTPPASAAYEPPSYVIERTHEEVEWKHVCSLCGAAVRHHGVHDEWHAALWVALSRTTPSAPREDDRG